MTAAKTALQAIRDHAGPRETVGLDDATVDRFLQSDPTLAEAILAAQAAHRALAGEYGELLTADEASFAAALQTEYVNFYPPETINPYVALAARGPWIVTSHGAVIHDNGGYGMLGMGHAPAEILAVMAEPHVMANVMTPNASQKRFAAALRAEAGQTRADGCPYTRFICMNSGSESVTVACRISDTNALIQTREGGRHHGRTIQFLTLEGSFHGRTDRPAQASDSCVGTYRKHLASHHDNTNLVTVPINDLDALRAAFAQAETDGVFFELFLMEPVMGEGNPGEGITPEFYALARELTQAHGGLLLVDSIQAGIRGTGYLSVVAESINKVASLYGYSSSRGAVVPLDITTVYKCAAKTGKCTCKKGWIGDKCDKQVK